MKAFKRVISVVMALAMVLGMGIMGVMADDSDKAVFEVNDSTVKYLGRHSEQNGDPYFSYGASGIRVNFTGTDFYAKVYAPEASSDSGYLDIMVLVDTEMPMEATRFSIQKQKETWLHLASDLDDGEHFIIIMKMSRGIGGQCGFGCDRVSIREIATNVGGSILTPDTYSDLKIEAYGDSITNGDAVWLNKDGVNMAYTYGAYSGVVSRLLGAELQAIGNTGNGLNSWVMGAGNLFPPRESWYEGDLRINDNTVPDHSDTDVLIINLGTNDMNAIGSDSEECAEYTEEYFKESYISWLEEAYEANNDILCIGTLGAMGADILFDDIQAACDYVNDKYGKEYAYFIPLDRCNSFDKGLGYDNGHPSNYAHEIYGLKMAKLINEKLGLGMEDELNARVPEFVESSEKDLDNIALYATLFTSDEAEMTDKPLKNANDGNTSSSWQINNGEHFYNKDTKVLTDCWLGFEFEGDTTLRTVSILWEADTRAAKYTIQYSDDGENWTEVSNARYSYGEKNEQTGRAEDVVTFDEATAKYFKIDMTEGTNGKAYCPQIFEVDMRGEAADIPETITKGDVNGDGQINSTDFMQVRRHFLNLYTIPEDKQKFADVNGDGNINSTDFMQIRRHFLGLYTIK